MWEVLTGRRDGKVSLSSEALANIPSPFSNFSTLLKSFQSKGLTVHDLVVLSDRTSNKIVGELQKSTDFFKEFAQSMKRMGAIGVLTDNSGEIRKTCGVINS
ncbi:hypothetical protein DKX38_018420 [Salix brachista]|uniref:peroxidase n=1 Tax=Salix brachista TaxID=2182728 RepID=A0A5N5KN18_9ROSI|nr:hypothetical protein DKX38_018420 [Salix brachista]